MLYDVDFSDVMGYKSCLHFTAHLGFLFEAGVCCALDSDEMCLFNSVIRLCLLGRYWCEEMYSLLRGFCVDAAGQIMCSISFWLAAGCRWSATTRLAEYCHTTHDETASAKIINHHASEVARDIVLAILGLLVTRACVQWKPGEEQKSLARDTEQCPR